MTGNGDQPTVTDDASFVLPTDVSLAGTAEFAVTRYERDIEAMTDAQLDSYAFTVDGAQLLIDEDIDLTLSGRYGVVTIAPDEESDARCTALKMQDVTVTADASTASTE